MYFYEVTPADRNYHGQDYLTYSHLDELNIGQLVVVKLRTKSVVAFISQSTQKPSFDTKPIERIIYGWQIPDQNLKLFDWLRTYYPGPLGLTASMFVPPSIMVKKELEPEPTTVAKAAKARPLPSLTTDQQRSLDELNKSKHTTILHGITGSGKTRVYIELAKAAISQGKSVLVLTPEIGLTPQLVGSFKEQLSDVYLTHSQLSPVSRRKIWGQLASANKPLILIGPRSALFMPLQNIGLIVIDEFHEPAYKNDQAPHYHAVRVSSTLARLHSARLVLGSATPPINEYFVASQKQIPIISMTQKATKNSADQSIDISIVDLKDASLRTQYPLLSSPLLSALESNLANKQQSLLFINRRGSARLIVCQACGYRALCKRCDLPLIYHKDTHLLRCHTCGQSSPAPNSCPDCGSSDITFKNPGTKAIAESLQKRFPDAVIARFDKDNTADERLNKRLPEISSGQIDILIGTQVLAKGHDLPRLSLVGVLLADNELSFPDFSSTERSYQLLHQIAGRVGRGHQKTSRVIIQTYDPESPPIQTLLDQTSWDDFYKKELEERRRYGFPPFYHVLKVDTARASSASSKKAIESISTHILSNYSNVELIGPTPSFIARRNGSFHWQLVIKAKDRSVLTTICQNLPVKCTFDIDPLHLL